MPAQTETCASHILTFTFILAIPAQGGGKAEGSRRSSTIGETKPNFIKTASDGGFFMSARYS
ncbi:hypothetical protein [Herminiimonas sp. CN]|uniref:hypothetical protein n=1 Tax=Herminiimonas sp. CN TaxID=1349818 RepID=UPI0012DDE1BD|nr:hypothetical protein [Herminiimonas sp. CN]